MIRSNEPSSLINLLEKTKTSKPGNMDFRTEYTDNFNKIGSDNFQKYLIKDYYKTKIFCNEES